MGGIVASEWRIASSVFSLFLVGALADCAIVDQYSSRAVSYNLEAEQALDQGLLLNIVRASQRRPMQFTSVQSITGTASAMGTATLNIPFGAGGASYKTGSFGGNVSGGPQFIIPVLDTQEFYNGVMRPVSNQLFDFFIHEEYPREEIFTLFVEKIVIHRNACQPTDHTARCELDFVNYPGEDLQFDLTQAMIEHLLNLGITTQQVSGGSAAKSAASGSSSAGQGANADYEFCFAPHDRFYMQQIRSLSALCGYMPMAKKSKPKITSVTFKQVKTSAAAQPASVTDERDTTLQPAANGGTSGGDQGRKQKLVAGFVLPTEFIDKLIEIARRDSRGGPADADGSGDFEEFMANIGAFRADHGTTPGGGKDNLMTLSIYTRSTEGILYFLGEAVRRRLYPDGLMQPGLQPRTLQIKIENTAYPVYPELPCTPGLLLRGQGDEALPGAYTCQNLFVLDAGPGVIGLAPSEVAYEGVRYWVPADEAGKTMHVLSIVKQLLAVNTSAKDLPQSNVISVISP